MSEMGFPLALVDLIMKCVLIVSCSILINGIPSLYFSFSRGLRQKDPLFSSLFLICAERLSTMIKKVELLGDIQGVQVCRQTLIISYTFFTDNSVLFSKALGWDSKSLKHILLSCEKASGQKINFNMSIITSSKNIHSQFCSQIQSTLGIQRVDYYDRYLQFPTIIQKSKKDIFSRVKDKVQQKLESWKDKCLSAGGKEILIKLLFRRSYPTLWVASCFLLVCTKRLNYW